MGRYRNPFSDPIEIGVGGLNIARPPHKIADTELVDCYNWWLSPNGEFEVRPGTTGILSSAVASSIRATFFFVPNDEIVFVSGTKIYKVARTGGAATELGNLSSGSSEGYLTGAMFCGNLFIASGGALQYYDGTSLASLTTGCTYSLAPPASVDLVAVIKNRLWLGNGSDINHSGVADYTDWGRDPLAGEGNGELLNGGSFSVEKDDGDDIKAFAAFQENLLVFKGSNNNTIHAITGTTSSDFYPVQKSKGLSCLHSMALGTVDSDVLFCGNGGIYSYRVVDTVGNTQAVPLSLKIKPDLDYANILGAAYSAHLGYFFVITEGNTTYLLHKPTGIWYRWRFAGFSPTSTGEHNDEVYFGGNDGQIYRLNLEASTDDGNEFEAMAHSKAFKGSSPKAINVKRAYLWVKYRTTGIISLAAYGKLGEEKLKTGSNEGEGITRICFGGDGVVFGGDGVVFGRSNPTKKVMFKINREADDVQVRITTTARIVLMHMSLDGAYLHKRGR